MRQRSAGDGRLGAGGPPPSLTTAEHGSYVAGCAARRRACARVRRRLPRDAERRGLDALSGGGLGGRRADGAADLRPAGGGKPGAAQGPPQGGGLRAQVNARLVDENRRRFGSPLSASSSRGTRRRTRTPCGSAASGCASTARSSASTSASAIPAGAAANSRCWCRRRRRGAPPRLYLINHGAALRTSPRSRRRSQRRAASTARRSRASVTLTVAAARLRRRRRRRRRHHRLRDNEPPTAADGRFHDRFMRGVFTRRDEGRGRHVPPGTELEGQQLRSASTAC